MVPDEELLSRSQRGDMEAFVLLIERYQKMLYTIAFRLLGNSEDAADAAQEALVRAYKNLPDFRGDCSFRTWLKYIITNICRDVLRRRKRRPTISLEGFQEAEGVFLEVADRKNLSSPEEIFLAREGEDMIHKLLQLMNPEYRMTLIMRDIQGFTYDEIAAILGCSVGTVKSRLSRARQFLRQYLLKEREHLSNAGVYIKKGGEGR